MFAERVWEPDYSGSDDDQGRGETGEGETGEKFESGSGDSFGSGSGDNFGNRSGDSFGSGSGDSFGSGSGDNFGNRSGDSFGGGSGDSFGNGSGDDFGSGSGEDFSSSDSGSGSGSDDDQERGCEGEIREEGNGDDVGDDIPCSAVLQAGDGEVEAITSSTAYTAVSCHLSCMEEVVNSSEFSVCKSRGNGVILAQTFLPVECSYYIRKHCWSVAISCVPRV